MKRFVSSFLAVSLCLTPALMPAKKASAVNVSVKEALNKAKSATGDFFKDYLWNSKAMNATGAFFKDYLWNSKVMNGAKYYGSKIKKAIEGDLSATPIPRPTSTPVATQTAKKDNTLKINEDDLSVKYFFVEGIGRSQKKCCDQDEAANRSNSTHVSECCSTLDALLDWFAELQKKYPDQTNPFWEGLLKERNKQRLATSTPTPTPTPEVTQTPTPTSTPEWTPTPEITPKSTPEVVQVAQIEGEL